MPSRPRKQALMGLAVIGLAGTVAIYGTSLSLATDLGYTDAQVRAACEAGGCERLVRELTLRGFPHATTDPVEAYVLNVTGEGVKQVLVLDWLNQTAQIEPALPAGLEPAAIIHLSPATYARLVGVLNDLQDGREAPAATAAQAIAIWLQSNVDVRDGNALDDAIYHGKLTLWAKDARA